MEKFKEYMLTDATVKAKPAAKKDDNKKTETPVVKKPSKETIAWWNSHNAVQQKKHVADNPDADIAKHVNAGHLNYGEKAGGGVSGKDNNTTDSNNTNTSPGDDKSNIEKGTKALVKINAMENLTPEEKVKKMRNALAKTSWANLSDEIREECRKQVKPTVAIMIDFLNKKTEIEKMLPGNVAAEYFNAKTKVKAMKEFNDICADNRKDALKGGKPIVGTMVSMVNELAVGEVMMECIHGSENLYKKGSKYELDVEKTYEFTLKRMKKTGAGKHIEANDKTKKNLEETCLSSALVAHRQMIKLHTLIKENNLNIKNCDVSFVWQDPGSTATLIAYIEHKKIENINGRPAKEYIKDVLLKGPRDGNTTDTYVAVRDKKTNEFYLGHVSNKKSNTNKIGTTSSPAILQLLEKKINKKHDTKGLTDENITKLKELDKEIKKLFTEANFDYSKKAIEVIRGLSNVKDKYYNSLIKKYYGKDAKPDDFKNNKNKKEPEFYNILMADATSEESTLDSKLKGRVLSALIKELDPKRDLQVNKTYEKMFDTFNEHREKLEKIQKGLGDEAYKKFVMHFGHINGDVIGGIEYKDTEINMGLNDTTLRFRKSDGWPCVKVKNKYYIANENGTTSSEEVKKEDYQEQAHATVINGEVLSKITGENIPPALADGFYKNIEVERVSYKENGKSGKADVFTLVKGKRLKIAFLSYQTKQGGTVEVTLKYDKEFAAEALKESAFMNIREARNLQGGKSATKDNSKKSEKQNLSKLIDFLNTDKELIQETVSNPKISSFLLNK